MAHPIRDRIIRFDRVPARDLAPHPSNWRRHPPAHRSALRGALEEIGLADALIVRQFPDGRLQLVDGRLRAELLDQVVPVVVTDLDEAEAEKFLLTFDPIGALAVRDDEAMRALLSRAATANADVQTFFDQLRVETGVKGPPKEETFDVAAALTASKPPRVRSGEVWLLGRHRILCGDATDPVVMQRVLGAPAADLVWTDPPYNVAYMSGRRDRQGPLGTRGKRWVGSPITNDDLPVEEWEDFQARWLAAMMTVLRGACYICMSDRMMPSLRQAFVKAGGHFSVEIVWVKNQIVMAALGSHYHSQFEAILYGWPEGKPHFWSGATTRTNVWRIDRNSVNEWHPTQKPLALIRQSLDDACPIGGVVLDPFLGSGSTLIAAE